MENNDIKKAFYAAKAKMQAALPTVVKGRPVYGRDGSLRYYYANSEDILAASRGALGANGFSLRFIAKPIPDGWMCTAILTHAEGYSEHSSFQCPIDPAPQMSRTHAAISAEAYARRIALRNVLGIAVGEGESEDEQQTQGEPAQPEQKQPERKGRPLGRPEPPRDVPQNVPRGTLSAENKLKLKKEIERLFYDEGNDWEMTRDSAVDWLRKVGKLKDGETLAVVTDETVDAIIAALSAPEEKGEQ